MSGDRETGPESRGRIVRLALPCDDESEWARVEAVLRGPLVELVDLDAMMAAFSASDREPKRCSFFADVPGSAEAGAFDFPSFFATGAPLLLEVALEMPALFVGFEIPIFKTNSSWASDGLLARELGRRHIALSRRQCACLLVHSVLGALKRPADVQPNDFRFTAFDLFAGSARSPSSAVTLLNYFTVAAKRGAARPAFWSELVTFERRGYRKGVPPWDWEISDAPLCKVSIADGALEDSPAEVHVEFANAFVGGGVMTGDAAMEEILFLVKPELMVAMAVNNRMADTEAVCVTGALQYSRVGGYGSTLAFAGNHDEEAESPHSSRPPTVCAIDAVRGGGPAMTAPARCVTSTKHASLSTGRSASPLATGAAARLETTTT
mmetsp:Transcript_22675/g.73744  ORF Transcript_22675/g.73744 Transcript_22675/m.73744 type:complete len:380 (-) Transcript_22675:291-1430(-)